MATININVHGYQQPFHSVIGEDFILFEHPWNDFGYYTTYNVLVPNKGSIGGIHIVQINQQRYENNVLSDRLLGRTSLITELPSDFVSVSYDMNLFNHLSEILSIEERLAFIKAMHLALGEDLYLGKVLYDKCFNTSVLRNITYEGLIDALKEPYEIMHSGRIYKGWAED